MNNSPPRYMTTAFESLEPFSLIPFKELEQLWLTNQQQVLKKKGWKAIHGVHKTEFPKIEEDNKYRYETGAYQKETKWGRINAKSDMQGKTIPKDLYENGHVLYFCIPGEISRKHLTAFLHNNDISILRQFLKEVDFKQDWQSLMNEYDQKYPKKHKTNKPEEYSWRANFSPAWHMSITQEGLLNPILHLPGEDLIARGSHRFFMVGATGQNIPVFICIPQGKEIFSVTSKIGLFNEGKMKMDINLNKKTVKYSFNKIDSSYEILY